jgi:predicted DNA-binding antitoxin AbrB/MazE fold protein
MNIAVDAIYEEGKLRPLSPLDLPENTMVRISLETAGYDAGRREWLAQCERSLMEIWDNEADDVYNALLSK